MGTWGFGIFENDVALDVQGEYEAAIEEGAKDDEATKRVLQEFSEDMEDSEEEIQIWLALAAIQIERGAVQVKVRREALEVIERGADLGRWKEAGDDSVRARRDVLLVLKSNLIQSAMGGAGLQPPPTPKRRNIQYAEGTWFAVPLRDGGFAVGVVVRMGYKGLTLGFFFGPRREAVPPLAEVEELRPQDAVLIQIFGDGGLTEGKWPLLGTAPRWDRRDWPMPAFGGVHEHSGRGYRMELSERDLGTVVSQVDVSREEGERLPKNLVGGPEAIEITLSKTLSD